MDVSIMAIKSRQATIEGAFALLGTRPAASLGEVAAHAGVGRATLHRHFRSREELMAELARVAIAELRTAVDVTTRDAPSHAEALRCALAAMVPLGSRHGFLAGGPVGEDPEVAAMLAEDTAGLRDMVEGARREGLFAADVPTEWIVQTFDMLIYTSWTVVRAGEATPRQAAALAWRTLTRGLSPPGQDAP